MAPSTAHSINDDTRTLKSETRSSNHESVPSYYTTHSVNEASHSSIKKPVSSNSFIEDVYNGPFCLMKSYNNKASSNNNWDYNSNAFGDPETMFTPYVSVFSDKEDEQQNEEDESSSSY